jgi:hypothetical protein
LRPGAAADVASSITALFPFSDENCDGHIVTVSKAAVHPHVWRRVIAKDGSCLRRRGGRERPCLREGAKALEENERISMGASMGMANVCNRFL